MKANNSRENGREPTAETCPLVLDGEMAPDDFSPHKCLACDEFDCRFSEGGFGSGDLQSRTFVPEEHEDDASDWDDDPYQSYKEEEEQDEDDEW